MKLSGHAEKRLRQRGKSERDIALITNHGTRTRDGYLLRNRDADAAIRDRKKEINRLEHLKGSAVIAANRGQEEIVVTVYPASRRKQRKMLSALTHQSDD